jgi:hypothetical protein
VLGLLVALFFWRILTPDLGDRASFPPGDFTNQFWAFSTFEARELSAGRLPLWNPYTYAGAPFWADIQSAVLYPLSLLTLLLSGPWGFSLFALEVEAVLHFWLAAAFTYLFVRRLTHHRGAALFAAVTFTFGGYLTGYPNQQLAILETNVWLPLLLYFVDRALIDRSVEQPYIRTRPRNAGLAGVIWGMAILAGHPQTAMFVLYTFLFYVVFLVIFSRRHHREQPAYRPKKTSTLASFLLTPITVLVIGLGLSAVAWLPGLEYLRQSVRAVGLYDQMAGGFPLYDPIQMLLPGTVSFYSPLYVGVLPLLLALWAVLSVRRRETTFWGLLAAAALLLSFGGETFLYAPFYLAVPGFGIFRGQERAAFVVSFALAVLAGYGFVYLTSDWRHSKARIAASVRPSANAQSPSAGLVRVVGWLMIGAFGLVVLFFYALNNAGWREDSPFTFLLGRSVWLAIILAVTWGIMKFGASRSGTSIRRPRATSRAVLTACYVLIAILDLFTINWRTNIHPSLPEHLTSVPAIVEAIRRDAPDGDVFRVYNEFRIYENYGVPYALEDTWGASPLRLARYDEMYRSLRMERLWELLNVKYVITWREELYAPSEIIYYEAEADDVTYVHRLNSISPRAWFVYQILEVDENAALPQLDAFEFDPAQVALVEPDTSLSLGSPAPSDSWTVEIVHRAPSHLLLNVTTSADGLLVLSEVDYPGWRTYIDGKTAPTIRVDYALRGVPILAGTHRVEMAFRPRAFVSGAVVSGLTLGALTLALLGARLRRRHR